MIYNIFVMHSVQMRDYDYENHSDPVYYKRDDYRDEHCPK